MMRHLQREADTITRILQVGALALCGHNCTVTAEDQDSLVVLASIGSRGRRRRDLSANTRR